VVVDVLEADDEPVDVKERIRVHCYHPDTVSSLPTLAANHFDTVLVIMAVGHLHTLYLFSNVTLDKIRDLSL
jgi:hypothetical protein